jgi:hypothetical protein
MQDAFFGDDSPDLQTIEIPFIQRPSHGQVRHNTTLDDTQWSKKNTTTMSHGMDGRHIEPKVP